jgi:hypothetical protein
MALHDKQCLLFLLQCIKMMGKHLFKDLTRCFTLLPCLAMFIKCLG